LLVFSRLSLALNTIHYSPDTKPASHPNSLEFGCIKAAIKTISAKRPQNSKFILWTKHSKFKTGLAFPFLRGTNPQFSNTLTRKNSTGAFSIRYSTIGISGGD